MNLNFLTLDFKTIPREEIVNFLLNIKEMYNSNSNYKLDIQNTGKKTKRYKKDKYINVESSFKQTKAKPNYLLSYSMNDPEFTNDYNTACSKVIKKAIDEKIEDKHIKLLLTKKAVKKSRNVIFYIFKSVKCSKKRKYHFKSRFLSKKTKQNY